MNIDTSRKSREKKIFFFSIYNIVSKWLSIDPILFGRFMRRNHPELNKNRKKKRQKQKKLLQNTVVEKRMKRNEEKVSKAIKV